jgi:hypothetical protein
MRGVGGRCAGRTAQQELDVREKRWRPSRGWVSVAILRLPIVAIESSIFLQAILFSLGMARARNPNKRTAILRAPVHETAETGLGATAKVAGRAGVATGSLGRYFLAVLCLLFPAFPTYAEVTNVTVTSRTLVAGGKSFGLTGSYEKLVGRIQFALDPSDPHNRRIVDLEYAPRGTDGRVRFSSDLIVLRPSDPAKGNGVLLFEVANRGRLSLLGRFNRGGGGNDLTTEADFGDGLLMRDGYTLVWIGWEIDVPAPLLRIDAPPAILPSGADNRLSVELMYNDRISEAFLIDDPAGRPPVIYPPAEILNPKDLLTVRDHFWDEGIVIPRERWRFVSGVGSVPKLQLDGGFEPGRFYRVTYHAAAPLVAGVGLAATRDAAAAFRYRSDLPIHGRAAYVFGNSQTGRYLRQFLYQGFNIDERDRCVFDAVWVHIAGAARGSFNERFATPTSGDIFRPTTFPFFDLEQRDIDGTRDGLESRYRPDQRAKIFYTNTPVEYWGGGRAAALTHTTIDGKRDLPLPKNVRIYLLAGTQHIESPFPPPARTGRPNGAASSQDAAGRNNGQQLINPTPQANVMRALLRALHQWTADGIPPPASQYPRLANKMLVSVQDIRFPALPGVSDPRRIVGPARIIGGRLVPLPHLVPQVDRDGNELAGIRVPELAVPLATTTGWNFRAESVGNPSEIYQLLGSYIPFPTTRASREALGDPRLSIEERYRDLDDYLQQIRSAATELIRGRYLLPDDLDDVLARAKRHWSFATRDPSSASDDRQ